MHKRRYPLLPFIVVYLKIAAVIALAVLGYLAVAGYIQSVTSWFKETTRVVEMMGQSMSMPVPAVKDAAGRLWSLLMPTIYLFAAVLLWSFFWGLSDMMHAARETEFRTRPATEPQAVTEPQPEAEAIAEQPTTA